MSFLEAGNLGQPSLITNIAGGTAVNAVAAYSSSTVSSTSFLDGANTGTRRPLQQGRGYDFDGTNDYVAVPHATALNDVDFSVSIWLKTDTLLSTHIAVNKKGNVAVNEHGWSVEIHNGDGLKFWTWHTSSFDATIIPIADINSTDWFNVVCTHDNTAQEKKIYLNGKLIDTDATSATITLSDNDLTFGQAAHTSTQLWDGQLADCYYYPGKILTAAEITYLASHGEIGTDPTTANLEACYKMDEQTGGTMLDASGNNHHGTHANTTPATFHATQTTYSNQNQLGFSGGVYLDGTGDYVTCGNVLDKTTSSFTVTGWYSTLDTTACVLMGKRASRSGTGDAGYDIDLVSSGTQITFRVGDGANVAVAPSGAIVSPDGTYHHFAGVCDQVADTIAIYVDGAFITSASISSVGSLTNSEEFQIGAAATTSPHNGVLKDIRVYDDALGADEVTYVYTDGVSGTAPTATLEARYQFDEVEGPTAFDSSGSGFHGTLAGDAVWHFIPRDESNTDNDIRGVALDYTGKAPQDAKFINSNSGTFDGVDDFIDIGDISASVKSISMWVQADDITLNTDYLLDLNGTDYITIVNGEVTTNGFAAATVTYYVNGIADQTISDITNFFHVVIVSDTGFSASDLDVARLEGTGFFAGGICDISLYTDELTSPEVRYLYDSTQGTDPGVVNLAGHWPLSEGAGEAAYDISGNGNHGAITNATLSTFWGTLQDVSHQNITGGFDPALSFNGTNQYVDLDDHVTNFQADDEGTIFVRFRTTNSGGTSRIFAASDASDASSDFTIYKSGSNRFYLQIRNGGTNRLIVYADDTTINDGEWHSLAMTVSTSGNAYYLDGSTTPVTYTTGDATTQRWFNSIGTMDEMQIGVNVDSGGLEHYWDGDISELRIYDEALTADNIAYLNSVGDSGTVPTASVKAHWQLDELEGTIAYDKSGNNYNGTLVNAPTWIRVPADVNGVSLVTGSTPANAAGAYHNQAETDINFNPSTTPEMANIYSGHVVLDGTGDYVTYGNVLDKNDTDNFSITGWFKTSSSSTSVLVAKRASRSGAGDAGYSIGTTSSGTQIVFRICDGTTESIVATGAYVTPNDVPHHFACVCDRSGEGMAIYIDGVLVDNTPSVALSGIGSLTNSEEFQVGAAGTTQPYTGDIWGVKVHNIAISASNVTSDMAGRLLDSVEADLRLASNALDYSTGNYHGQLVGDASLPKYTVPTAYTFEDTLGEQRNHFKKLTTPDVVYALFNSTSSVIDIPNQTAETAEGSIVVDFFCDDVDNTPKTLVDVGGTAINGLIIFADDTNGFTVQYGNGVTTTKVSTTIVQNQWYRAYVRWTGSDIAASISGIAFGGGSNGVFTNIDTYNQVIGDNPGNTRFHSGGIAGVWIYGADKGDNFGYQNEQVHSAITDVTDLKAYYKLEKDTKDYSGLYADGSPTDITFAGTSQESNYLIYTPSTTTKSNRASVNSSVATSSSTTYTSSGTIPLLANLTRNAGTVKSNAYGLEADDHTSTNWGANAGQTSREFLTNNRIHRIRWQGTLSRVKMYVEEDTAITAAYIKVWRNVGANSYDLIGSSNDISGDLSGAAGVKDITLSTTIEVQEGDYVAYRLEWSGGASAYNLRAESTGLSNATYYATNTTPSSSGYAWESQTSSTATYILEAWVEKPHIVMIGDSIMAGHNGHWSYIESTDTTDRDTTIPYYLNTAFPTYGIANHGIGGNELSEILTRFAADVTDLDPKYVIIEGGLNDMSTRTNEQMWGDVDSIISACETASLPFVLMGMFPRTAGTDVNMARIDVLNAGYQTRAEAATDGTYVSVASAVGEFRSGGDPGNLWDIQAAYDGDGTHYTAAGHAAVAEVLRQLAAP